MDQNSQKQKTYPDLLHERVIFVIVSNDFAARGRTGDMSPFTTLKSFGRSSMLAQRSSRPSRASGEWVSGRTVGGT
jgi:hypothetical protein